MAPCESDLKDDAGITPRVDFPDWLTLSSNDGI